ncbi:MAG: hypothetical protein WKG00_39110 [Polyangiaceae bacterium]
MSRTLLFRAWWLTPSLVAALCAASIGACSADGNKDDTSGSNSGNGGNGNGAGSGHGASDPSGSGGEAVTVGQGVGGSGVGGGCVGTGNTAQKVPLDLFVMLDQSGSMDGVTGSGESKWTVVTNAFNAFVAQPETAGIGMGLQYFGLSPAGCPPSPFCTTDADCGACGPCLGICLGAGGGDSCNAADYATAEVPIQPLPGVANAITASLGMHGPSTGTPTLPALQGAVTFASSWATQNPSHVTVVVFATDGIPEACDINPANIEAAAAAGFNAMPSIRTFVIGVEDQMGGGLDMLNGIAAAGGTGQAFLISADPNAQQAFLDALNEIQGAALPCAYVIPDPPMGEDLDFNQVNVEYTPGGGGQPTTLSKVDNEAACGAAGGWYYDNPVKPTQILLCPASCQTIGADTEGQVKIVLGCGTIAD